VADIIGAALYHLGLDIDCWLIVEWGEAKGGGPGCYLIQIRLRSGEEHDLLVRVPANGPLPSVYQTTLHLREAILQ
jgi:hypothetical protein